MKLHERLTTPSGTYRVARLFGVELLIRPSLILMAVILIVVFAPRFADTSSTNPYFLAFLFVIALYVSVLLHELAHVVAARRYRMRVPSITLHLLGGETAIEGDSRSPAQEFWTAVVGPVASLLIGGAAWLVADAIPAGDSARILIAIAYVNAVVGLMNLVPGLPLDGGRVFRAAVWAVAGNRAAGSKAAGWSGRLVAVVVVAAPFLWALGHGTDRLLVDFILAIVIAAFLWTGASYALKIASRDNRLDYLSARELAVLNADSSAARRPTLSADLFGADLLRAMAAYPSDSYLLVERDGTAAGLLYAQSVDAAYQNGPQ